MSGLAVQNILHFFIVFVLMDFPNVHTIFSRQNFGQKLILLLIPMIWMLRIISPSTDNYEGFVIFGAYLIAGLAIIAWGLSMTIPAIKNQIYFFSTFLLILLYLNIIYSLYVYSFDIELQRAYLVFIILSAWYLPKPQQLFWMLLLSMLGLMILVQLTPQHQTVSSIFIRQALTVSLLTFLVLGIQSLYFEKFKQDSTYFKKLIHHIQDGLIQLEGNGKIVRVNEKFCDMIGYAKERLEGRKNISAFISKENRKYY